MNNFSIDKNQNLQQSDETAAAAGVVDPYPVYDPPPSEPVPPQPDPQQPVPNPEPPPVPEPNPEPFPAPPEPIPSFPPDVTF